MNYTKATLQAPTKEAIIADIKSIEWKGEAVYPDYPDGYEVSFAPFERFVIGSITQIIIEPGNENTDPVLEDWQCKIVLPKGFDLSTLNTVV